MKLLRALFGALPLLPLAFALGQVSPYGVSEALGCSGAGSLPTTGWTGIYSHGAVSGATVATDGFFVLSGGFKGITAEAALEELQLTVTSGGELVPGEVTLLSESGESLLLGWASSSPLSVGTALTATAMAGVGTANEIVTTLELSVLGEPTQLVAPELVLDGWVELAHGVGPTITCTGPAGGIGSCSPLPPVYDISSSEERRDAVDAWLGGSITGYVAWSVRVDVVSGSADALLPDERLIFSEPNEFEVPSEQGHNYLGLLGFPADSEDYCATLTVEDLRTGDEVTSEVVCATPQAAAELRTDNSYLSQCTEPPNEALTESWCELHPGTLHAACAPFTGEPTNTAGSGGSAGAAPSGTAGNGVAGGAGGSVATPTPEPPANSSSATSADRTSEGCSIGGRAPSSGAVLGLLLLGLLQRRRRARH